MGHSIAGNLLGGLTASGVELFFVLSAVVLAAPYVRSHRSLNIGRYAARRCLRLFPPYWAAWLLAGAAVWMATRFPTWWTEGASLPEFSSPGWLAQVGILYLGSLNYNFAWWSLTVEMAFYVLLPALIPLFRSGGAERRWVAYGVSVAAAVLVAPGVAGLPILGLLSAYASCFAAGLVLARGPISERTAMGLMLVGAAWVGISAITDSLNPHVGWGAVYFGLVARAMDPTSRLWRLLSGHAWVWLGERSYSLFLVHFTVIGLVCHAVSYAFDSKTVGYFLLSRALSIALSLLATVLLFHFIERRFAHGLVTAEEVFPWHFEKTTPAAGSGA